MTSRYNTVDEYSRYAAQEFLQTVVFVDDRIYEEIGGAASEHKSINIPNRRKSASRHNEKEQESDVALHDEDGEMEYSPRDIVMSFAKKGIVCSLYQPKNSDRFSEQSGIFSLCLAADIVIVDWDMYGDKGERASELIDNLIHRASKDIPEQLRLILVYTKERALSGVADKLNKRVNARSDKIQEFICEEEEEEGLAFHTTNRNSRVSILGKVDHRSDETQDHFVKETELADVAVKEFSKLASGLLRTVTLLGLAEIKRNSRKVLSKFDVALDPAFLTHRAMGLPEDDAYLHITPLLVSEIESVLEDVLPTPLIPDAVIKNWVQNVWKPGSHFASLMQSINKEERTNLVEKICLKGFSSTKGTNNNQPSLDPEKPKGFEKASRMLLPTESDKSNHEFSRLLASRTFYDKANHSSMLKSKALKLGSVVLYKDMDEGDVIDRYFLCVQPVCDSVRLKSSTSFIFVELTKATKKNQVLHVVEVDNQLVELYYQPKSYNCYVAKFAPDSTAKQVLPTLSEADGKLVFNDFASEPDKVYYWIDQLRPAHAQRAVVDIARDLSRVGLTESEWLRRLAKYKS